MAPTTGRDSDKFMLRLPEGMRDEIASEAAKSGRSMNAEIVHRLANSLNSPRFEDAALGLGEELDFDLMVSAGRNNRSLRDEMVYRLNQSLGDKTSAIHALEDSAYQANRKYNEILRVFMQLTPEERRRLEERVEIAEAAKSRNFSAEEIGEFVSLHPIGQKGRVRLTVKGRNYSPLLGDDYEDSAPEPVHGILTELRRENEKQEAAQLRGDEQATVRTTKGTRFDRADFDEPPIKDKAPSKANKMPK